MIHIESCYVERNKTFMAIKNISETKNFVFLCRPFSSLWKESAKGNSVKKTISDIWNTIVWRHTYISSLHLWMFQFLFVMQLLQKGIVSAQVHSIVFWFIFESSSWVRWALESWSLVNELWNDWSWVSDLHKVEVWLGT